MTKEEELAFNRMLVAIANSKKKKFVETDVNEHTAMVPLGDVLAELRGFVNFIKAQPPSNQ